MEDARKEQCKKTAKVIAKAWSDETFKEKLLKEPGSRAVGLDDYTETSVGEFLLGRKRMRRSDEWGKA
jgi:hypothetical protein